MTTRDRKARKTSRSGARWWQRVLVAAVGLLLGLNLYRWNASALAGNALPMPFGTGMAVVLSGSMSPALEVNDLVVVRARSHYDVGDIVVYQSGNTLIVHRIIAENGETVVTKGDANNVEDAPIALRDIKGEVIAHVPAVGLVVNMLKTPAGILTVLAAAFVLTELSFRREKGEDDRELDAIKEDIRRLKAELDSDASENPDRKPGD